MSDHPTPETPQTHEPAPSPEAPAPKRADVALSLLSPHERARAAAIGPRDVALLVFRVERGASEPAAFGVELHRTREILRARPPTRLPFVPSWLEGVVSVRGRVMPVVDVAARLGIAGPAKAAASDRFVVVHVSGTEPAALRVCAVDGVRRFRPELLRPARDLPFIRALAEEADLVRVLDVDALCREASAAPSDGARPDREPSR